MKCCGVLMICLLGLARNTGAQPQRQATQIGVASLLLKGPATNTAFIVADSLRRKAVGIRVTAAIGGVLVGTVGGAFTGAQFRGQCNCDDPGFQEAVEGFLIGGVAGAALGAALPRLNSVCSFNERIGRSLIGAVVGGILGATAGGGTIATIFTAPLGGAAGALGSLGRCWRSTTAAANDRVVPKL